MIGIRATIGSKVLADSIYCIGRGVAALRPHAALNRKYLWNWISYRAHELSAKGKGATFKQVNKTDLLNWRIPLPPIEEQRRIARVLDAADALRVKRCQILAKLDLLVQAVFFDMFGDPARNSCWSSVELIEVCETKGEYGASVPSVEFDGSRPRYLRITDIRDDGTLIDKAVSPGRSEKNWRSKYLRSGDLLFARSGASVGKSFLMRDEHAPLVFAGYLIRFVPDRQKVHPEYLYRYTQTQKYRAWVERTATTVAQPNINAKKYASLELPLPPLSLQRHFADVVEQIMCNSRTSRAHAEKLDTLFASLQQRAFRGEL